MRKWKIPSYPEMTMVVFFLQFLVDFSAQLQNVIDKNSSSLLTRQS